MSLKYVRRLIVRAIEDVIVLMCLCIGIAGVCSAFTLLFRWLGIE